MFKGNLRGQAAKSYEKLTNRMQVNLLASSFSPFSCSFVTDTAHNSIKQNKLGDEYKIFLLVNPEDDKPVAVVVPRKTLQPETTGSFIA